MNKKWLIIGVGVAVAAAAAALWGPMASNVEQARYNVVEQHGKIELRDYAPHIVAEVSVSGEREAAIDQGFRLIAGYIFGGNQPAQKVAMTAPVLQQAEEKAASQKIAMTAPVQQQAAEGNSWLVRFVMPAAYTMASLPKPTNEAVKLREVPAKKFAAIQFSGRATAEALAEKTAELTSFLQSKQFVPFAAVTHAYYNPPWTLPFMRRNEVLVEVQAK